MSLYHCSPTLLAPGSVILPGNYGRIISLIGENHNFWQREVVLEQVRAEHYSDKPSRLNSAYACETLEAARFYRTHQAYTGIIYEVEQVEAEAPIHRGDFNCVQPLPGRPENMEQIAHLYWNNGLWTNIEGYPGLQCVEILTLSPLRVIRQID